MRPEATCSHPGCGRRATEVAAVESTWEDASTRSALMMCSDHAESYVRPANELDTPLRARRRARRAPTG